MVVLVYLVLVVGIGGNGGRILLFCWGGVYVVFSELFCCCSVKFRKKKKRVFTRSLSVAMSVASVATLGAAAHVVGTTNWAEENSKLEENVVLSAEET